MPHTFEVRKTPKGRDYVRAVGTGVIDEQATRLFNDKFAKGAPWAGLPALVVNSEDSSHTVEARNTIGVGVELHLMAAVAVSAARTARGKFMLKAMAAEDSASHTGRSLKTRAFAQEAEAVAWLDAELDGQSTR